MRKRQDAKIIAINTHLFLYLILFLVFLSLSISCAAENAVGMTIAFAILTLSPVFAFAISPLYFVFSGEAVEIVYNFGQRELIKWSSVRSISLMGSWTGDGEGLPYYEFAYIQKEKRAFFVVGEIPQTRTTKKLIKRYYKKDIV